MAKTYYPTAVQDAFELYKYLTRYQQTLTASITGDQLTALGELIACLANFLQKWPKQPLNP